MVPINVPFTACEKAGTLMARKKRSTPKVLFKLISFMANPLWKPIRPTAPMVCHQIITAM
jgi:hypothetical protein